MKQEQVSCRPADIVVSFVQCCTRACSLLLFACGALVAFPATAALTITHSISNTTPTAGGSAFAINITVTNTDVSNAVANVQIVDPLPGAVVSQGVVIDTAASTVEGAFSCRGPALGTNGSVICSAASMPANGLFKFSITAQIDANVASGVRQNNVRVTGGGSETVDSKSLNIVVDAPLTVQLDAPANAVAGSDFAYLISLQNGGTSTAINANVRMTLPAGISYVGLTRSGAFADVCSFSPLNNQLNCLGRFPTGLSTVNVLVRSAVTLPDGALNASATITTAGTGTIAVGTSNASTTISH